MIRYVDQQKRGLLRVGSDAIDLNLACFSCWPPLTLALVLAPVMLSAGTEPLHKSFE